MGGVWSVPELQAVGWALVHSLWQGAVVALVLAGLLWRVRRREAALRHGLAWLALGTMLVMPIATGAYVLDEWREHDACWAMADAGADRAALAGADCLGHGLLLLFPHERRDAVASAKEAAVSPTAGARLEAAVRNASLGYIDLIAILGAAWLLTVAALLVRTCLGWRRTRRLATEDTEAAPRRVRHLVEGLRKRIGMRRTVGVRVSPRVDVPTVLGWRRPTLLLPRGACEALDRRQLESVLAHELTHVRREDYAANLAQTLIDTLLFFNPAARWISKRVREERELCCDAVAASVVTGRISVYLRALLTLEDLRATPSHPHALALTGGGLVRRIRRLAAGGAPRDRISRVGYAIMVAGLLALGTTIALTPGPADIGSWVIMTRDIDQRETRLRAAGALPIPETAVAASATAIAASATAIAASERTAPPTGH